MTIFFNKDITAEFDWKKNTFLQNFAETTIFTALFCSLQFCSAVLFKRWRQQKKNIEAMIYHFKQIISDYSIKIMIKSIMFLSRKITDIEFKYWSIELKLAGLIWVMKKTKHMIKFAQQPFIIYINHEAAVEINRQKFLFTFSTDKLNLRLIKTFEYCYGSSPFWWTNSRTQTYQLIRLSAFSESIATAARRPRGYKNMIWSEQYQADAYSAITSRVEIENENGKQVWFFSLIKN